MQIEKHYKDSYYQIRNASGRAISNYEFNDCKVDSTNNCVIGRYHGYLFVVGQDGRLLIPYDTYDHQFVNNLIIAKKVGTSAYDIYDYKGHILMENLYDVSAEKVIDLPNGKTFSFIKITKNKGEEVQFMTPDLKPIAIPDVKEIDIKNKCIVSKADDTRYNLYNLAGDILVKEIPNPIYQSLSSVIPYSKAGKDIQSIYAREEYEKLKVFTTQNNQVFTIYSTDGREIGELIQRGEVSKLLKKAYKKCIVPFLWRKEENEKLAQEKLTTPLQNLLSHTKVDVSTAKLVKQSELSEVKPKITGLHIFPVVQPSEVDAKPDKQTAQRLKTSKYGKIKGYEKIVEPDGFIYYKQEYTNGKKGVADAKGNVIIPPTRHLFVYHSTSQYFSVFPSSDDELEPRFSTLQLYTWDGHLLIDCEKKGFKSANFSVEKNGVCYIQAENDGQYAYFDYFGVQITPWMTEKMYYSSPKDGFCYFSNYKPSGYFLASTSHKGGKPSQSKYNTPNKTNQAVTSNKTKKSSTSSSTSSKSTPTSATSASTVTSSANSEQANAFLRKEMRDEYWRQYQSATTSQAKLQALMQCMGYCDDKDALGTVLCNIGVIYHNSGQTDVAVAYYQKSVECGNSTARLNLDNINKAQRRQNRMDKLMAIGNALTQMGSSIANNMSGNTYNYGGGQNNFLSGLMQGLSSGGSIGGGSFGGTVAACPLTPKYANGTTLSDGGTYNFFDSGVGKTEMITYSDGSATLTTVQRCHSCVSTGGKCLNCQGTGNGYNMLQAADRYIQCPGCGGSGVCGFCHGSQWSQPFKKHYRPGEAEAYMQAVREQKAEERANRSSSSSSSSSRSSNTCTRCGGKKYEKEITYNKPAEGRVPPYLNTLGVTCSICGDESKHWHWVCVRCAGTGKEY